jgi:2-polyprenyl-3-methyl-5-hydroxy-6-metoxy-1,4-benzoquinol methylase
MSVLTQALGGISGGKVLDIATEEGNFITTLARNLKSYAEIIGIDIIRYTKVAESIFSAENVWFMQMDTEWLGFEEESFDTVSISNGLHHLEDIPRCVGEIKRVLKSGGNVIIREVHRDIQAEPQLTDMNIHHWVAEIDTAGGYLHNKTFTRQELVDIVEGLNLCNVVFFDILNTDLDPMNEAAIKENERIIKRYIQYTDDAQLPGHKAYRKRGEELQRQLRRVGIQWEPELIIVGEKL